MGLVDQSRLASFVGCSEAIVPDFESSKKTLKGFKQMGTCLWLHCEDRLEESQKEGVGTSGGEGTFECMAVAARMLMGPLRRGEARGSHWLLSPMKCGQPSLLDLGLPIGKEHRLHSQATSGLGTPVWNCCTCCPPVLSREQISVSVAREARVSAGPGRGPFAHLHPGERTAVCMKEAGSSVQTAAL